MSERAYRSAMVVLAVGFLAGLAVCAIYLGDASIVFFSWFMFALAGIVFFLREMTKRGRMK